jgi:hypothetical protein
MVESKALFGSPRTAAKRYEENGIFNVWKPQTRNRHY